MPAILHYFDNHTDAFPVAYIGTMCVLIASVMVGIFFSIKLIKGK